MAKKKSKGPIYKVLVLLGAGAAAVAAFFLFRKKAAAAPTVSDQAALALRAPSIPAPPRLSFASLTSWPGTTAGQVEDLAVERGQQLLLEMNPQSVPSQAFSQGRRIMSPPDQTNLQPPVVPPQSQGGNLPPKGSTGRDADYTYDISAYGAVPFSGQAYEGHRILGEDPPYVMRDRQGRTQPLWWGINGVADAHRIWDCPAITTVWRANGWRLTIDRTQLADGTVRYINRPCPTCRPQAAAWLDAKLKADQAALGRYLYRAPAGGLFWLKATDAMVAQKGLHLDPATQEWV